MKTTLKFFKILADETRLRILALLLNGGELCVCDLVTTLQLPQSTVSRHLAVLKKAGFVSDRPAGIWTYYTIAGNNEDDLWALLKKRLSNSPDALADKARLDSCCDNSRCA